MKLIDLASAMVVLFITVSPVQAVTLTFDDIPDGSSLYWYYRDLYGIAIDGSFNVVDHTNSAWGPPHSGNNVLVWPLDVEEGHWPTIVINKDREHPPTPSSFASIVGGYFSTEPGHVLQMRGYHSAIYEEPVSTVTIGSTGESWNNVYVQMGSSAGIGFVEFRSVTPYGVMHFSVDDLNVEFVPEPSSLAALALGLSPLVAARLKRKQESL